MLSSRQKFHAILAVLINIGSLAANHGTDNRFLRCGDGLKTREYSILDNG